MKKIVLLSLIALSLEGPLAHAQRFSGPGGRMGLEMCIKTLDATQRANQELQMQLNRCDLNRPGPEEGRLRRENEQLRREVDRLSFEKSGLIDDNMRLERENRDLRRQLEDIMMPRSLGYFSYAACTEFGSSKPSLQNTASGVGQSPLEAESKAQMNLSQQFRCTYGAVVVKTEELRRVDNASYCVAGCLRFASSQVDPSTLADGRGRNKAEAEFNALLALGAKNTCSYGAAIQNCQ